MFREDFSLANAMVLNQAGLIPAPMESVADFERRAHFCLKLKELLSKDLESSLQDMQLFCEVDKIQDKVHDDILKTLSKSVSEYPQAEFLLEANRKLAAYYDTSSSWISLFFSNHQLPFWQGGCAWIFQMTEDSPTGALIQLRKAFSHSSTYLGIYEREELLEHELVHVGRMEFKEPIFEEILSYRTSKSMFRRLFGPLFQSSMESFIFLLLLGFVFIFDNFLFSLQHLHAHKIGLWLWTAPLGYFAYLFTRLLRRQKIFNRCLKKLSECLGSSQNARYVIYRLQDKEIVMFSKSSIEAIKEYAREHALNELRWKVIVEAYFKH